jgi:Tfp pilus assembly protein PilF
MVRFHLGMALYKAGEKSKAKDVLEKVLLLDPEFVKAVEVREILGL